MRATTLFTTYHPMMHATYRANMAWLLCPYQLKPMALFAALEWLPPSQYELMKERQIEARRGRAPKPEKAISFGDLSLPYRFTNNHFEMPMTVVRIVSRWSDRRELAAVYALGAACEAEFQRRKFKKKYVHQFDVFAVWASYVMNTSEPVNLDNIEFYSRVACWHMTSQIIVSGMPMAEEIAYRLGGEIEINFNPDREVAEA